MMIEPGSGVRISIEQYATSDSVLYDFLNLLTDVYLERRSYEENKRAASAKVKLEKEDASRGGMAAKQALADHSQKNRDMAKNMAADAQDDIDERKGKSGMRRNKAKSFKETESRTGGPSNFLASLVDTLRQEIALKEKRFTWQQKVALYKQLRKDGVSPQQAKGEVNDLFGVVAYTTNVTSSE